MTNDKFSNSTLIRSARILNKRDQRKIIQVVILQISFGLLDLIGVGVVGMVGALAIRGVSSNAPGDRVAKVLHYLHLENQTLQMQVAILGTLAALLLIGKTIFSIIFTRRTLIFLSGRAAAISSDLFARLISQPLVSMQQKSLQERLYAITGGVEVVTVGILGSAVSLVSDISLLFVMGLGLFLVDPVISFSTVISFGTIGFILYRLMHNRAEQLGRKEAAISIESLDRLWEVFHAYREIVVRNRRGFYSAKIREQRTALSKTKAELAFMPNISKYVIEVTVVLVALVISSIQFLIHDANHAVGVLTVFMAASTRIAPAVLRVQQGMITIRGSIGAATPTLTMIEDLSLVEPVTAGSPELQILHNGFTASITIKDLSFIYPGKQRPAIQDLSLEIERATISAVVGKSGAGKTTLVDLILGIIQPTEGFVQISGKSPLEAISEWPGSIGYVPQDVMISTGTIRQNVALGFPEDFDQDQLIWEALEIAQLDEFVRSLPEGLDTSVGDRGTKISGGQRQRLGIARAMFTKPLLLVLDEATSSLDGKTESDIADAIQGLRGSATVILIAHRLSTLRSVDTVLYLEDGSLIKKGTFEEVRRDVPDFDEQATLMGL